MKKSPFEVIPGIGPSMSIDLEKLGYSRVSELRGENPAEMFEKLRVMAGGHMDRCVLYVFRCAVYFAENKEHDPKLLKWWNWKDKELDVRG
jgi:hypothetical protein